jgi:hypothetical protein
MRIIQSVPHITKHSSTRIHVLYRVSHKTRIKAFWNAAICRWKSSYRIVEKLYYLHLQGQVFRDKLDIKLTVRIRHDLCCYLTDKRWTNTNRNMRCLETSRLLGGRCVSYALPMLEVIYNSKALISTYVT